MASGTSKKFELKLTNVARASLEELLLDYQDFLRQRGLPLWEVTSPKVLEIRRRLVEGPGRSDQPDRSDHSDQSDRPGIRVVDPEIAANTLVCLIHQASYLLGRQIKRLEEDFEKKGGFTERLYAARRQHRQQPGAR